MLDSCVNAWLRKLQRSRAYLKELLHAEFVFMHFPIERFAAEARVGPNRQRCEADLQPKAAQQMSQIHCPHTAVKSASESAA